MSAYILCTFHALTICPTWESVINATNMTAFSYSVNPDMHVSSLDLDSKTLIRLDFDWKVLNLHLKFPYFNLTRTCQLLDSLQLCIKLGTKKKI
jgi:hypothetical protein